ncbi:12446_t:CDS:2, partial [Ambispora leptoticha]
MMNDYEERNARPRLLEVSDGVKGEVIVLSDDDDDAKIVSAKKKVILS